MILRELEFLNLAFLPDPPFRWCGNQHAVPSHVPDREHGRDHSRLSVPMLPIGNMEANF